MILTITLNASVDKAYRLSEPPVVGTVMRVDEVINTAGGKGLNVARAINNCGGHAFASGLVGGHNGHLLMDLLKEDGVDFDFCQVNAETRSCINVIDSNYASTEFLEPGFSVSQQDIQKFLDKYDDLLWDCNVVTLSGSLPKGISNNFYADLITLAQDSGVKAFLDSSGKTLTEGLKSKPFFAKPNTDEIKQLFGLSVSSIEEGKAAALKLQKLGVEHACVSMGKLGAVVANDNNLYWGCAPGDKAVNPVGCGDTFVAAYAVAISEEKPTDKCLAMALAASKANALTITTGHFDTKLYKNILENTEINSEKIKN